jgi:chromosome segregation ATPase
MTNRGEIARLNQEITDLREAFHLSQEARDNWRTASDEKLAELTRFREALKDAEKRLDAEGKARMELLDAHLQLRAELTRLREENERLREAAFGIGPNDERLSLEAIQARHAQRDTELTRLRRIEEAARAVLTKDYGEPNDTGDDYKQPTYEQYVAYERGVLDVQEDIASALSLEEKP